jgi:hypothetical protein
VDQQGWSSPLPARLRRLIAAWLGVDCARAVASMVNLTGPKQFPLPNPGNDMNPFNAFKHCYWNCEMVKQCGYGTSLLSYLHELYRDADESFPIWENWTGTQMDLENKSQGRQCAEPLGCDVGEPHTDKDCATCCVHKLTAGKLPYQQKAVIP